MLELFQQTGFFLFSRRLYDTKSGMWNKIYLIALAIAVLIMSSLAFYSNSWLDSIDAPVNVIQNYEDSSGMTWMFLWLSSIILLILANVFFWRMQQSWAFWTTFLYFAAFIIIQTFLLDEKFTAFRNSRNPGQSGLSVSPFLGVILCVVGAIFVFFDQFLVSRLHKKMFGIAPEKVKLEGGESEL